MRGVWCEPPDRVNLIEEFKNDVAGLALIKDWLGAGGKPVPQTQSDHRAYICANGNAGGPCQMNCSPHWWNFIENSKNAIAQTILAELEVKNHLHLKSASEDSIWMCRPCGCCLKLKVWTPIEHIKAHTRPEQLSEFPNYCWIKKEIES